MNVPECFISLCIPAYKRPENINRLLQSISIQSFNNYEIIITDDSPDDSLRPVLQKYTHMPIVYYKNEKALGTPANWNYAVSKARGEWIKLMHDDDWLATEKSLEIFARETRKGNKFIFSAYSNVFQNESKTVEKKRFPSSWRNRILNNPLVLLSENVIGPPSVTLVHKSIGQTYDTNMKWRVDIDFYVRVLSQEKSFSYINEALVNVGISESQVTNACINQPEVELPEGVLLLLKYGVQPLRDIRVYDSWWRILRNLNIRSRKQLEQYTPYKEWPTVIFKMIEHQGKIKTEWLSNGLISKVAMAASYFMNLRYLNQYK